MSGFCARLRRLQREALGMNRRNLAFLVPYNPRALFGVAALLNVSIFPMVIMSNVIENFTTTQVESGTREALRLTINTLVVCAACHVAIERGGVQSIVLSYPETLLGVVALEVLIGKWRGLRLLEYVRFYDLVRRQPDAVAAAAERPPERR